MTEELILDDFKEDNWKEIQESFGYRMLLTLLWLTWSVWLFYHGTIMLETIREEASYFPYKMETIYEYYLIAVLALGMGVIIFKKSENRIFYLFSIAGVLLILLNLSYLRVINQRLIVFLPMFMLLFVRNLRACLICYILNYLLFALVPYGASDMLDWIKYLFTRASSLSFCTLIFMSAYPCRRILFPLNKITVKLQYRLFWLLGFTPIILEYIY